MYYETKEVLKLAGKITLMYTFIFGVLYLIWQKKDMRKATVIMFVFFSMLFSMPEKEQNHKVLTDNVIQTADRTTWSCRGQLRWLNVCRKWA